MGLGKGTIYLVFLSLPSRLLPHKTAAFPPHRGCCQQLFQFMLYTQQLPGGCLEKQTEEWWERRRRGVKTGPDTKRTI